MTSVTAAKGRLMVSSTSSSQRKMVKRSALAKHTRPRRAVMAESRRLKTLSGRFMKLRTMRRLKIYLRNLWKNFSYDHIPRFPSSAQRRDCRPRNLSTLPGDRCPFCFVPKLPICKVSALPGTPKPPAALVQAVLACGIVGVARDGVGQCRGE